MSEPKFQTSADSENPRRTTEYMSVPVFGLDGQVCLNLQVISKRKRNSRFLAGFTNSDDTLFQLFALIIQIKVHETLAKLAQSLTQVEVVQAI